MTTRRQILARAGLACAAAALPAAQMTQAAPAAEPSDLALLTQWCGNPYSSAPLITVADRAGARAYEKIPNHLRLRPDETLPLLEARRLGSLYSGRSVVLLTRDPRLLKLERNFKTMVNGTRHFDVTEPDQTARTILEAIHTTAQGVVEYALRRMTDSDPISRVSPLLIATDAHPHRVTIAFRMHFEKKNPDQNGTLFQP